MNTIIPTKSVCTLFFGAVLAFFLTTACTSNEGKKERAEKMQHQKEGATNNAATAHTSSPIQWIGIADLEAKMKEEPRKVLIDTYTDWCGWCKVMDKQTFTDPTLAQYINDNFYAVKFDAETTETIKFKGKDFNFVKNSRKGTNLLTYYLILGENGKGSFGYPTLVFLDEQLNRIDAYAGFKKVPELTALSKFVKENRYKTQKFDDYLKQNPL